MITPAEQKLLEVTLDNLAEHFPDVVLLVSRPATAKGEVSDRWFDGRGNHFARIGMTQYYTDMQKPLIATVQSNQQ